MNKYLRIVGVILLLGFNSLLIAKSTTLYNVPYTVKCYNKAGVRISCDKARSERKIVKKRRYSSRSRYYKNKYYRLKREMAKINKRKAELAKQKANQKIINDRRELALQNKKLQAEMQALRDAQKLATAKQTETPDSVILAPEPVGANLNPEPITKTIAEEKVSTDKKDNSNFSVALESWGGKSLTNADSPMSLGFDVDFGYKFTDTLSLDILPAFNVSFASGTTPGKFSLGDTEVKLTHAFYKDGITSMAVHYRIWLPTSSDSLTNKTYLTAMLRGEAKFSLWNSKGYLRFRPSVAGSFRKYATSTPTTGTVDPDKIYTSPTSDRYEKLDPNERFNITLETKLSYNLNKMLTAFGSITFKGSNMYADETFVGGSLLTITPATWKSSATLTFPALGFNLSPVYFEVAVKTSAPLDKFSLFNPQDGNDTSINFFFMYTI